jgi:rfaE bifunctional protein nucleotidyltransferase chain/domain
MKKIVFTNGCFDLLHIGHIQLLEYSKSLGDYLIVGLNSDESVKNLKGQNRPVNNQETRKKILESIKYVDEVMIFDTPTPLPLIELIRPEYVVKGGDYKEEEVVGYNVGNTKVRIFEYVADNSTTRIIENIANRRRM